MLERTSSEQGGPIHIGEPLRWRTRLILICLAISVIAAAIGLSAWSSNRWRTTNVFSYATTDDPRRIEIDVGTCNADHRLRVEETTTVVRLYVEHRHAMEADCGDVLTVGLSAPLGDRAVVTAVGQVPEQE